MPKLRTVTGEEIVFPARGIFLVTSRVGQHPGATVYGATGASVDIGEQPEAFLDRINLADAFVKLSRPGYGSIWVAATAVTSLRLPRQPEFPAEAQTVISLGSMTLAVTAVINDVTTALNQRGAEF